MKVHEAITAVMSEVGAVGKSDQNTFHRFNFRGIDTTVNALSPAMRKHGLTVHPSNILSVTYEEFATKKGERSVECRLIAEFTFTGPEGDELKAVVAGSAADTGDKSTPKAMSVAFRTALLQSFALPTQETDPDAHSYERAPQWSPPEDFITLIQSATTPDEKSAIWQRAQAAGAPGTYLEAVKRAGS